MTSTCRVRTALLTAVLVASVAGCGDASGDARVPGSLAGEGPTRPAAGGGDLVVDALPLEAPMILDPAPEGLQLTGVSHHPPEDADMGGGVLFGDPDLADTLDGPVLLLGSGSAYTGPPRGAPGGRDIDLGGRTGRVAPDDDRIWVLFEDREDQVDFVVGRGIGEDEVIDAARGADFDSSPRTISSDAVPHGLQPLVAGGPPDGPGGSQQLSFRGDSGGRLSVHVTRADPRLAALWGFWTGDAAGTLVRGVPGSAGDMRGSSVDAGGARGRIWAEDGLVLAVVTNGIGEPLLDQAVRDLRPGSWAEFEAMRRQILDRPPTPEEAGCFAGSGFVSGVHDDMRWAFALHPGTPGGESWSTCTRQFPPPPESHASSSGGGGGGTGGVFTLPPVGELATSDAWSGSQPPAPQYAYGMGYGIVGGVAPPGTTRVTVTTPDGRTLEAQLSDVGPRPGERVWGLFIPQHRPPPPGRPPTTATAHDAAGDVLDSATL